MLYKLKPEARQFFNDSLQVEVGNIEFWQGKNIHINLLEKSDKVYIEYGIKTGDNTRSLKGLGENNKGYIDFTLNIIDLNYNDYKNIPIPELMDALQRTANDFFTKK